MNVINKIKNMGHIPKENRTHDKLINNVKSHHIYEVISSMINRLSADFYNFLKNSIFLIYMMMYFLIKI